MINSGVAPVCVMTDCNTRNTQAYIDETTMNGVCNQTICNNVVNLTNISAGGSAAISPTLQNECGPQLKAAAAAKTASDNSTNNLSSPKSSYNMPYMWIIIVVIIIIGIMMYNLI
jgi:hypothetical protein